MRPTERKLPIVAVNLEREIFATQQIFAQIKKHSYDYSPAISLYREDGRVANIIARQIHDGETVRDVLIEMGLLIPAIQPTMILFSSDGLLDAKGYLSGTFGGSGQIAKQGVEALCHYALRDNLTDCFSFKPYLLDHDRALWWLNIAELDGTRPRANSHTEDVGRILQSMFTMNPLKFSLGKLLQALRSMGHRVTVAPHLMNE